MPEMKMSPGDSHPDKALRICIAANFTVEPIDEFLKYWLTELAIGADTRFAPYNQIFQQLFEGGLLRSNLEGINLIALDLDTWLPPGLVVEARTRLTHTISDLIAALRGAGARGAGGAVLLFPSNSAETSERSWALDAARASILAECSFVPGWSAIDLTEAVTLYSVSETRDGFTDELGNIPFTEEMYAVAATMTARWIRATFGKSRKVIALDCDNTLWQGICGEGSLQFTEPYRRLQEFILRQQEKGVLLALASKNNEADVMAALQSEGCLLRPEHLTAWRINWRPKSENLRALSEELGLGLNTFVLLDDSSYECMEVRNQIPEVLAIQLPPHPDAIPDFLDHLWIFDHPEATEEDRNRASLYQAERQRAEVNRRALTPEEFLASLRIETQIAPVTRPELARVAQLTQRTTQFNLTGVLHSEQTLSLLLATGRHECWTVRVRDLFGDYGLVGVLLFEIVDDALRVDTFLLSCRALGRHVEYGMVDKLRRLAAEHSVPWITLPVVPSSRNLPALEFLNLLCGAPVDNEGPFECVLSSSGNYSEWRPVAATPERQAPFAVVAALPVLNVEDGKIVYLAKHLRTAAAVISATRMTTKRRPSTAAPLVAPRNAIEEALVRTWSECLGIEPIGVMDNFLDFGGHSLVATRILAHARHEFGVELTLAGFFEVPTVEGMAHRIADALLRRRTSPLVFLQ